MASPLTLRLDEKTRQRIARIARRKKLTTSEVLRQAIEAWVDREEPAANPYELMKDLIGVVHGGDPKRSEQIGRKFRESMKQRRSRK
ncbi:MAG TPA: ribbon-helix-helix protein, CopG family [Candidatus Acidoferrum sp.]|jgi:predicted DNA-binding protein|nr:ribbon-helix-helix protein, CopG family [Candidatus Acidoferrum sp.]